MAWVMVVLPVPKSPVKVITSPGSTSSPSFFPRAMVLLQVRESFNQSIQWAAKHKFDTLPLYDSGVSSDEDVTLTGADDKEYPDRQLARVFPTSYVLDRNGTVLFSHQGPASDWREYLDFFSDVVKHASH